MTTTPCRPLSADVAAHAEADRRDLASVRYEDAALAWEQRLAEAMDDVDANPVAVAVHALHQGNGYGDCTECQDGGDFPCATIQAVGAAINLPAPQRGAF